MDNWMEYQKTFYEVADRRYETNMQNISQQYDWDFVKGVIRSLNEFEYSLDPKKDITIFRIKHNNRAKNFLYYFVGNDVIYFNAERTESDNVSGLNMTIFKNVKLKKIKYTGSMQAQIGNFIADFGEFVIEIEADTYENKEDMKVAMQHLVNM